ncbi:hypothetical protein [Sphingobium sp. LSP13-1-1.1]
MAYNPNSVVTHWKERSPIGLLVILMNLLLLTVFRRRLLIAFAALWLM